MSISYGYVCMHTNIYVFQSTSICVNRESMRNTIIIAVVASSDMMGQLSAFRACGKMVVSLAAPGDHILLFHVKNG